MNTEIGQWIVKSSIVVLDSEWAKVHRDTCVTPSGKIIQDYYYWEGGDFAQVFALTLDDEVILTKQYKHGVKEVVIELPAGMISSRDDGPMDTARRELLEETGYEARSWLNLGVLNVSSAKMTTRSYPYLALGARRVAAQSLDENEEIEILLRPINEVLTMLRSGEIRDSNSVATCLLSLIRMGKL